MFVVVLPAILFITATDSKGPGAAVVVIATLAALWSYQWYLVSTTGQTLGKRWAGIRIVKVHLPALPTARAARFRAIATVLAAVAARAAYDPIGILQTERDLPQPGHE